LVIIAGSAGCFEPLNTIVKALPPALDAAVVILVHRPPNAPSRLAEILGGRAHVPVRVAFDGMAIVKGFIYLAPNGYEHVRLQQDRFVLAAGPRISFSIPAADPLFESAARFFGPDVIAVVLSGGGSNGTNGVMAVKRERGTVLVQDPREAMHDSMPRHVLSVVRPDLCAGAQELADRLAALCGPAVAGAGDVLSSFTAG
jgi:two-component system chemotaxis response regulator CheB